jgi:PIN domain nuclease of toxin-antitoxin system
MAVLSQAHHDRYVSLASLWEIQIKTNLGKLILEGEVHEKSPEWLRRFAAELLPIEVRHLGSLYKLPLHHRDPFDRILLAQAIGEGMTIVSPDRAFRQYDVAVIW